MLHIFLCSFNMVLFHARFFVPQKYEIFSHEEFKIFLKLISFINILFVSQQIKLYKSILNIAQQFSEE